MFVNAAGHDGGVARRRALQHSEAGDALHRLDALLVLVDQPCPLRRALLWNFDHRALRKFVLRVAGSIGSGRLARWSCAASTSSSVISEIGPRATTRPLSTMMNASPSLPRDLDVLLRQQQRDAELLVQHLQRSRRSRATMLGWMPSVGSSSSSTLGSTASARAMASCCFWPPESKPARRIEIVAQIGKELAGRFPESRRACPCARTCRAGCSRAP